MCRIGLIGSNSIEYISILVDIWLNEDCAVLLDRNISRIKAIEILREANVNRCFVEDSIIEKWDNNTKSDINFEAYNVKSHTDTLLPDNIYVKFQSNYSKDEAVILYSSGTTGRSKGVILSFYSIHTNADAILGYMNLQHSDCLYLAKPLSHASTLTGELVVALKTNTKIVVAPVIVPPRYIFEKIKKYKISILCVNPMLLEMLLKEYSDASHKFQLDSLQTVYVSGSILTNKLYKLFYDLFPDKNLFNVYGLTEAAPRVTAQTMVCKRSNSVGIPIPGVQVCIVDEEGNPLGEKQCGVIHVNTPSRFLKYVCGNAKHKSLYKNWLNTGDIGFWDEFKELHVVGRVDDVIFIGAHKIYPSEVEATIINHTPIKNCVVVSVADKHNLCCLYTSEIEFENKDLISNISKFLLPYEIPKYYIWQKALPCNQNGKISRKMASAIVCNKIKGVCNEQK